MECNQPAVATVTDSIRSRARPGRTSQCIGQGVSGWDVQKQSRIHAGLPNAEHLGGKLRTMAKKTRVVSSGETVKKLVQGGGKNHSPYVLDQLEVFGGRGDNQNFRMVNTLSSQLAGLKSDGFRCSRT